MTDDPADRSDRFPQPLPARLQREKRPGPSGVALSLTALAILAALMLGVGVFNLVSDTGPVAKLKAVLLATSASIVAYAVNRFAIEKGAQLASVGFRLGSITSLVGIVAVGGAMFTSTFSGLVLPDVQQRILQDYGRKLMSFVSQGNQSNLQLAAMGPVLQINSAELAQFLRCEIATSCISGRGEGGRGPVAKALETPAAKAAAVAAQFDAGRNLAEKHLSALNSLLADYQKNLSRADIDIWQRQGELMKIQARIEQETSALVAALPIPLLRAYASELAAGVSIADRPDAATRINAILKKHADAIGNALAGFTSPEGTPPAFPSRAGVVDTFHYIGEFASIAAIVFVAELMLPLTIWMYTFLALRWAIEQVEPVTVAKHGAVAVFPRTLTSIPPPKGNSIVTAPVEAAANDAVAPRRRGRPPGRRA